MNKKHLFPLILTVLIACIAFWPVNSAVLTQQSNPTGLVILVSGSTIAGNGTISITTAATASEITRAAIYINQLGQIGFGVSLSAVAISTPIGGGFNQTALGGCISSTVTITLPISGSVEVGFKGQGSHGTLNAVVILGILQDGAYGGGGSSSVGVIDANEPVAGDDMNMSFTLPITGLSAGDHNFCLLGRVAAGEFTWDTSVADNRFWVKRLP